MCPTAEYKTHIQFTASLGMQNMCPGHIVPGDTKHVSNSSCFSRIQDRCPTHIVFEDMSVAHRTKEHVQKVALMRLLCATDRLRACLKTSRSTRVISSSSSEHTCPGVQLTSSLRIQNMYATDIVSEDTKLVIHLNRPRTCRKLFAWVREKQIFDCQLV